MGGCCCERGPLMLGSLQALSLVLAPAPPAPLPLFSVDERQWLCRWRLVVDSQTRGSSARWCVPAGSAGVWGPHKLSVAVLSWQQAARWHPVLAAQLLLLGHVTPWASPYSQPSRAFPPSPRPGLKAPSLRNAALSACCSGCRQYCNICSPCHLLPSNSFFIEMSLNCLRIY